MSYSSLPLTSKLFQLTSLTCALALAGCGGGGEGDTVDSIDPVPPLGEQPVQSDGDTPDGDGTDIEQPEPVIKFASIITPSISELGGSGNISVKLTNKNNSNIPINGKSITPQLGSLALRYGVEITANPPSTDFFGNATFIITIPELNAVDRAALKSGGINYQLSYTENGISYESEIQAVNIITPVITLGILNAPNVIDSRPAYTLYADDKGDSVNIQAQLSNQTIKEQIIGQQVTLAFDNKLAGLLTVDGQPGSADISKLTEGNGVVSFDIVVPKNLTNEQKDDFNNQVLTATLTETLTGQERQVKIKVQTKKPELSFISQQSDRLLNLNGGETQIEVIAQDNKDNVIAGQKVFLALPADIASQGVMLVSGGSQTTDNSGRAVFTIAVPNNLTEAQKLAIGNSFKIGLSAADANGNIFAEAGTVTTVTPTADSTTEKLSIGADKVVDTTGESDTFQVLVRVTDKNGSIEGREVRLDVAKPLKTGVSITNNTAKTSGDGVAIFDLVFKKGDNVSDALLEAGIKVTATTTTFEGINIKEDYILAVDDGILDNYKIVGRSDKTTLNTGGDQTTTTFRVTDTNGGILVGVPVRLSIKSLDNSGAVLTTPSIVMTDAEGKVEAGVILAANTVNARLNHSIAILAEVITPLYDAAGNSTMDVRAEITEILSAIGTKITLDSSLTNLNPDDSTTITTTLIDGAERAITNADIELIDAEGENIVNDAGEAIKGKTNADGVAEFNLEADNLDFDDNGNLRIFARVIGERQVFTQRSTNSINLVKVSQAGISFIDIEKLYNANEPQLINVQIRTDDLDEARALVGKDVEVETTLGTFVNNSVTAKIRIMPNDIDNADGRIINIPVTLTSTLAGTAVLQATVLGEMASGTLKYQTTVDTRFRATTPATMSLQAVRSTIVPQGSTEVVALIEDEKGVPVEGETVVFSRTTDDSAGRLSAATAVTNSKGEARVVYRANASTAINGVVINAVLRDYEDIKQTVNITVSKEAVYTTLAFSNELTSDNIYYTLKGSISVMDGSGQAVPKQDVSIKSYAIEYAQGNVCLLDSKVSYQTADNLERYSEQLTIPMKSGWFNTEDPDYNYTLEKDDDLNGNNRLDAINPVSIIGSSAVSDDGYTFVTDEEGRADFSIRYPIRYANWVKVRFDASTLVNGSENMQSLNFVLPYLEKDVEIINGTLKSPWANNASAFGAGGAQCIDSMSINIDEPNNTTRVLLTPSQDFSVNINGEKPTTTSQGFNSFIVDFNQAFAVGDTRKPLVKGAEIRVSNSGFSFENVIRINRP